MQYSRVLASISWRLNPLPRLFFEFNVMARRDDAYVADVVDLSTAINTSLLDEKLPEDLHGFVRDLGRRCRNKTSSLKTMYETVIRSKALDKRCDKCVSVGSNEIANLAWRVIHEHQKVTDPKQLAPEEWPDCMNKILGKKSWSNPSVKAHFESCVAFWWVIHYERLPQNERKDLRADAAWWSRLVPKHHMVRIANHASEAFVCVASCNWGALLARLESVEWEGAEVWRVAFDAEQPTISIAFFDGFSWEVAVPKPIACDAEGICKQPEVWESLLRKPLLDTRAFATWEWEAMALAVAESTGWTIPREDILKWGIHDRRKLVFL